METEPRSDDDSGGGWIEWTVRGARRVTIGVLGGTVLLTGLALTVLPGPAFVVIPIGLGILGLEFAWARHWLRRVREHAEHAFGSGEAGASAPRPIADADADADGDADGVDGH